VTAPWHNAEQGGGAAGASRGIRLYQSQQAASSLISLTTQRRDASLSRRACGWASALSRGRGGGKRVSRREKA